MPQFPLTALTGCLNVVVGWGLVVLAVVLVITPWVERAWGMRLSFERKRHGRVGTTPRRAWKKLGLFGVRDLLSCPTVPARGERGAKGAASTTKPNLGAKGG